MVRETCCSRSLSSRLSNTHFTDVHNSELGTSQCSLHLLQEDLMEAGIKSLDESLRDGTDSMKWSKHLALSFKTTTSALARVNVVILSGLAGYWWLGHIARAGSVFCLKAPWRSTQCVWTVHPYLPAAGLKRAGREWDGWSSVLGNRTEKLLEGDKIMLRELAGKERA